MEIRKLTRQENVQAQVIGSIAFLFPIDVEAARKKAENPDTAEYTWGCVEASGRVTSAVTNWPFAIYYDGHTVGMGGIGGVCTLPEARMKGSIRAIFEKIFADDRANGRLFSVLFPFSHAYYRQFGYELCRVGRTYRMPTKSLQKYKACVPQVRMRMPEDSDAGMRDVYAKYASRFNYAVARDDVSWKRALEGDPYKNETYQYILSRDGADIAYCAFKPLRDGDALGMQLTDFAYVDEGALHALLGFFYKLNAPYAFVQLEAPDGLEIPALLDEPYDARVVWETRTMARVIDVQRALELMRHPQGEGAYSLRVADDFLPENTGCYHVRFGAEGVQVRRDDAAECDLSVTAQAFAQLCIGYLPMSAALYRQDVALHGNAELLHRVFVQKPMCLTDRF